MFESKLGTFETLSEYTEALGKEFTLMSSASSDLKTLPANYYRARLKELRLLIKSLVVEAKANLTNRRFNLFVEKYDQL